MIKLTGATPVPLLENDRFGSFGEGCLRFFYASSVDNILVACRRIREWLQQKNVA